MAMVVGRRRDVAALGIVFCLAASGGVPAAAQQTSFAQRTAGHEMRFSYAWKDAAGASQTLAFPLPVADIEAAMVLFRDYSIPHLYGYMEQVLSREAKRAGVTLVATRVGDGASFRIYTTSREKHEAFGARLDGIVEGARQEWLRKHARRAIGNAIHLDYPEAARRYVRGLRPVASALAAQLPQADERTRVARALSFVQSIPYDDLSDPRTTGGIEYAPPPAMFRLNRGDCDSKTVALAAILRSLVPARRVLFMALPQHVALAVDLPPREGDARAAHDGRDWLLLEPTGPAVVAPGQVSPVTAWYIDRPGEIAWFELTE
jgi:hypothetical protein